MVTAKTSEHGKIEKSIHLAANTSSYITMLFQNTIENKWVQLVLAFFAGACLIQIIYKLCNQNNGKPEVEEE